MKNTRGFTLAEVLVTLAVIGVVAALTIPTIVQVSSEKQAKTSVKKSLSVLNQIIALSIAENGESGTSANTSAELKALFQNYMKVIDDDTTNNAFTTADGMIYSFHKEAGTDCGTATDDDPGNSTQQCIIEVDINGKSGNSKAASTTSYTDLYYLIVKQNTVNPANNSAGTWDPTAISTFRALSGTVDNVAVEALIN